jgi:pimeloyl-ACP methyl ester carboxylesterase
VLGGIDPKEGRMRRHHVAVAILVGAFVVAGISRPVTVANAAPPAYFVDESKLPFDALAGTTTSRWWGVHSGAGYRIEVPANWNGSLVLYAHGFRGTGLELTVSNPSIRSYLVTHGFAWAASSFAKNGYDVKQGVKDTHALGELFRGLVGPPVRTYVIGHSMGGHITAVAIEQYPTTYAGALPMCGVMGDVELFDYFLDYNLLAQALAGWPAQVPAPADYLTTVVPAVKAALGSPFPTVLNANGEKLKAATEQLTGGERPTFDLAWTVWNDADFLFTLGVGDGTVGVAPGTVAGNADTTYQLDGDPALSPEEQALNEAVLRVDADPQGTQPNGLANIPPTLGTIRMPVLSLHTLGDLFSMEQIYAQRVATRGASGLLVTRAVRDVGHCGFSRAEQETAFADLVTWVEKGVKPAGDDVLNPAAVAAASFGCSFTLPPRPYAPCA